MARILIIEDNATIRESVIDQLGFEGFEMVGAENGRIGIEMARELKPDLILSDVMMPEVDGYGVLQALRSDPATASIPFILLTAKADKDSTREGLERGADDYIAKPFILPDLLARMNRLLDRGRT